MEQDDNNCNKEFIKEIELVSDATTRHYKCKWTINNYSLCNIDQGNSIDSPEFFTNDTFWRLQLYPNGCDEKNKDYVSLLLFMVDNEDELEHPKFTLNTIVDLSVLNNKGIESQVRNKSFSNQDLIDGTTTFHRFIPKTILNKKKKELLPNDQLTILCKIRLNSTTVMRWGDEEASKMLVQKRRLREFDDYEKVLKKSKFSDVEIIVGDRVFSAHKAILSARSRVFDVMFDQNMKENLQDQVVIVDIDAELMELVLCYIYVGKIETQKLERRRRDLYMVADKYELNGLKEMCKDTIIQNLQPSNVAEALIFIDTVPDLEDIKIVEKAVLDFVVKNSRILKELDSFQETYKTLSSDLLFKLLHAYM